MTDRNGFISSFEFLLSLFMSHQWNVTHKKAQNGMIFKFRELFCLNIAYEICVPIIRRVRLKATDRIERITKVWLENTIHEGNAKKTNT